MKLLKVLVLVLLLIPYCIIISGCTKDNMDTTYVEVIYNLEGGQFQNSTRPAVYHYQFKEGTENLIKSPDEITQKEFIRAGYYLEGWYQTKIEKENEVIYENRWDFEHDYVKTPSLTLYANWKKIIKNKFNVCYVDENNETVILGSYPAEAGEAFDDYGNYYKKRIGYTKLYYKDEEGNRIDSSFKFPEGEDITVNIYVEYIEGIFEIVTNAKQLKAAKQKNIYLDADIDLGGEAFSFSGYNKTLIGNGHTISNFTVLYDASINGLHPDFEDASKNSLSISIFGNTKNANVTDITFTNVLFEIATTFSKTYKIYCCALAVEATCSTFKNVTVEGTLKVTALPINFNKDENLIIVLDKECYIAVDSTLSNNLVEIK